MNVTFSTRFQELSTQTFILLYLHQTVSISPTETTFLVLSFPWFSLFLSISEPQSAGFSSEPPTRPFSLHLGVWLPKQMGRRGEEKLKVKQQPKRSSTPSLSLCIVGYKQHKEYPQIRPLLTLVWPFYINWVSGACLLQVPSPGSFSSLSNLHTIRHLPSFSLERTTGQVVHTWIVKSVNSALPSWMDAYVKHSNYN